MAGMPKAIETSDDIGGAGTFFKQVEGWLNDEDDKQANRALALSAVAGNLAGVNTDDDLSGPPAPTLAKNPGINHFNKHWRGGSSGWWPNISAARVNSQMGSALVSALAPENNDLKIRFRWDCRELDLNAPDSAFQATVSVNGSELWIDILSPRAPGNVPDPKTGKPNWGFNAVSNLPPGSLGPFTPLGDLEVANYDGAAGIDNSFDVSRGEMVPTPDFRESWSLFPLREPVENGSQVLTGLSYTRDSWRPVRDRAGAFEDEPFHSEIGYLLWDAGNGLAYRLIAMPRGVIVLAVARADDKSATELTFKADASSTDPLSGGILSNPILSQAVTTDRFTSTMRIVGNGSSFTYEDTVEQRRAGGEEVLSHTNSNSLYRI